MGIRHSGGSFANAVRWVLLFPAAVVGYIIGYSVFFHLAGWNLRIVLSNPGPVVPLFAGAAGAVAFVLVGASAAPKHRGVVALVLLITQVVFLSLYVALYASGSFGNRAPLAVGLEFAGNAIGVTAGFYLVFRAFGWHGTGPISRLWREPIDNV